MQAANDLKVHLGWAVQVYNAAEALPNLVNPFWMLPLLGVLGLRARDVVGFTFLQLLLHLPIVLFLLWALAYTLEYHPPSDPMTKFATLNAGARRRNPAPWDGRAGRAGLAQRIRQRSR